MANDRILVVDDDTDYLTVMSSWLESVGYKVETVTSGEETLHRIEVNRPQVVFIDLRMPEMDGIETLKRIRAKDKELPVVIVTAYGDKEMEEEASRLGISGFFPKGENFSQAAQLIEMALIGLTGE